jgi:hypothetical protein
MLYSIVVQVQVQQHLDVPDDRLHILQIAVANKPLLQENKQD